MITHEQIMSNEIPSVGFRWWKYFDEIKWVLNHILNFFYAMCDFELKNISHKVKKDM